MRAARAAKQTSRAEPQANKAAVTQAGADHLLPESWGQHQHQPPDDHSFTDEQISECRDLFSMFDTDGGGTIDREEFGAMMRALGLSLEDRELDDFFAEMDNDCSGHIEFDELLHMLRKISRNISLEEEYQEAFKYFDLDGGGQITKVELMRVLDAMGEDTISLDEADEMIKEATNGNDEVTFDTFKLFCKGDQQERGGAPVLGDFSRKKAYSMLQRESIAASSVAGELRGPFADQSG